MAFIKIDQDGKIARVNSDHVILVAPASLINQTQLILTSGLSAIVKGSVDEIADRLEGKDPPLF